MKPDTKLISLKYLTLGLGGLGFVLQRLLYTTGTDEKGLLICGHWAQAALLILSGLALILILRATRDTAEIPDAPAVSSAFSGIGCLLAAAALFIRPPIPQTGPDTLYQVERTLSTVSQVILCILAFCRFSGRKTGFLLHSALCLYFSVRMVGQYRFWSSVPQLMDYAFFLLAHVALTLFVYQLAARDAGNGRARDLWRWGLAALYLCCCAPCGRDGRIFLFLLGIWVFLSLDPAFPEESSGDSIDTTQEVTP